MQSPFIFGSTVSTHSFTNRVKEIDRLYSNMINGANTIIISPRRWGKSSLVELVAKRISSGTKSMSVIQMDLFSIRSEDEFLSEFARLCIKGVSNKIGDWTGTLKEVFSQLSPRLVLSTDAGDFSLGFDSKRLKKHKEEIINLPEVLAAKYKKKIIICIDEFQNIRNYKGGKELEKSLRSYWQRHENVTFCLYGSKRHMMSEIFNASSNPFYRFGDIMMLSKIEQKEWVSFIVNSFAKSGKKITPIQAMRIAAKMENHSWYVQQLAHFTWVNTDKKVSDEIISSAMEDIIASQFPFFEMIIDKLSVTQVNLLKAILKEEKQYTATEIMRSYSLGTPNNVRKNLKTLSEQDIIDRHEGQYIFLDPVFKIWMERTFLKFSSNPD